jgi:hypothetical protein
MKIKRLMVISVLLVLSVGCGSTDGNSTENSSGNGDSTKRLTDLPKDKKISELTEEQRTELCTARREAGISIRDTTCQMTGLDSAYSKYRSDDSKSLEDLKNTCGEDENLCQETMPSSAGECGFARPDECNATVEEIETCAQDQLQKLESVKEDLRACTEITKDWLDSTFSDLHGQPESCKKLNDDCAATVEMDNNGSDG